LRRALIAALVALLLGLAMPVGPAFAASAAKVVVVVGPVGSHTAHYTADARAIVAEAKRYTPNVVLIVTPGATWARVRAAAQGANILVYLGHGNGWPSIYAPFETLTKDGLGLDPDSGANGTRTAYYGEGPIRDGIRLAPNAVVLLFHLCYASGNAEPGLPPGTFADARGRVDNFGAGFIGAGARAVFAEGHPEHPVTSYIRQLFTTNRTMDQLFRAAPTWHGNLQGPFASQRTPGLSFELDSDSAGPTGFYLSLAGDLGLRASSVVASGLAGTGGDPAAFAVPGAAEVTAGGGAGLFGSAAAAADPSRRAATRLPRGTTVRLVSEAPSSKGAGTRVFRVTVLGRPTKGFVRARDLAPRDSVGIRLWTLDQSGPLLSPNGDGQGDSLVVAARFSERAGATLTVRNAAGTVVRRTSTTGDIVRFEWNLKTPSGGPSRDGRYTWTLSVAPDARGNAGLTRAGSFAIDTTGPVTTARLDARAGGGGWLVSPATVTLAATDALSGVDSIAWGMDGGATSTYRKPVTVAVNGTHTLRYRATDRSGTREGWKSLALRIDTVPPTVGLPLTGRPGDRPGTWRGPVTLTPAVSDATSGAAGRTASVDGAPAAQMRGPSLIVKGEGRHTVSITAADVAGNTTTATTTFTIDSVAPVITTPAAGDVVPLVTPNGDGRSERVALPYSVSEPASVTAVITADGGTVVRTLTETAAAGANVLTWDGRTAAGLPVPDGRYTVTFGGRDAVGNTGAGATTKVDVYAALSGLGRTPAAFFPQDADRLAPTATATFTLRSPAKVTVRVFDPAGVLVRVGMTDRSLPAGAVGWAWDGRTDAGSFAPRGTYRIVVTAGNGAQSATQETTVLADAFRLTTSAAAAVRGKNLTVTAVTSEPLASAPRITVRQPGVRTWSVLMKRTGSVTWVAVLAPRKGGSAGTLSLTIQATDTRGGSNASTMTLPLR
jgi:flagellar hook assembly protein FlgD